MTSTLTFPCLTDKVVLGAARVSILVSEGYGECVVTNRELKWVDFYLTGVTWTMVVQYHTPVS